MSSIAILILHKSKRSSDYYKWLSTVDEDICLLSAHLHPEEKAHYTIAKQVSNDLSSSILDEVEECLVDNDIRKIIAMAEEDILRAAQLRERLGISGQNVESAFAFRNKVQMKTLVSDQGITCPQFAAVHSYTDVIDFTRKAGFPFVFKPVDGFGGMRTVVVQTEQDLLSLKADYEDTDLSGYMVEAFVDGEMYSVNGIALEGSIVFSSVNKYSNGCLFYQESEPDYLVMTVPEQDPCFLRTLDFTQRVLDALPTPEVLAFHCELFVRGDEITFCEIASRPPGGWISESIYYSHGIDIKEAFVKLECGVETVVKHHKPATLSAVLYVPKYQGKLVKQLEAFPFEWVKQYIRVAETGAWYESAAHSTDVIGAIVYVGDTVEELQERSVILKQFCNEQVHWEFST
ncbi:ATP-grasp domain-containing protein [Paenibacillus medicaginis]|uniref:Acetyl-CoA carboxylase biotin carboxylase subunit family protein n=1 Tax=Paenibacillus medicaginis TaxID=1470560 RepID=A0ABV5BVM4_9BACL